MYLIFHYNSERKSWLFEYSTPVCQSQYSDLKIGLFIRHLSGLVDILDAKKRIFGRPVLSFKERVEVVCYACLLLLMMTSMVVAKSI